jgi:hypothetical protein
MLFAVNFNPAALIFISALRRVFKSWLADFQVAEHHFYLHHGLDRQAYHQ